MMTLVGTPDELGSREDWDEWECEMLEHFASDDTEEEAA